MKDVLKLELKKNASNNNLIKLDEFVLVVNLQSTIIGGLAIYNNGAFAVRVIGNSNVLLSKDQTNYADEVSFDSGGIKSVFIQNNTGGEISVKIGISNADTLRSARTSSTTNIKILSSGYIDEKSDYYPLFRFVDTQIYGNILDLVGFKNIITDTAFIRVSSETPTVDLLPFTNVTNINMNSMYVGNISVLGKLMSVTNLAFGGSKCTGTIESLVAEYRRNGKNEGSVTCNSYNNSYVTFNGTTAGAKSSLSWTANTITMNGVTIDA